MEKEIINSLLSRFEGARHEYQGVECWSARELQEILGYKDWRNFTNVIDKAKLSCLNSGNKVSDHFVDFNNMVEVGSNTHREIDDVSLTRYACYLIAQNGDSAKNEIAFAQTYFALQTRKQELIEKHLLDVARLNARDKLSKSEKKLSSIIYERGVDEPSFALIRSKGDRALFGGYTTSEMKEKLGVSKGRPLADFLPTLTIKAKDFATELTSHNVIDKNLKNTNEITKEHIDNNTAVRKMLKDRGVKPEELPPDEDVKKVQRRIEGEKKNLAKGISKSED
jgi:DNA-damage-inducible protein D